MPADLSKHARTLVEQYRLDDGHLPAARAPGIRRTSGRRAAAVDLTGYPGLTLVGVQAGATGGPLGEPRSPRATS